MFLEKIKIIHFRKFNKSNNEVVLFNNYMLFSKLSKENNMISNQNK